MPRISISKTPKTTNIQIRTTEENKELLTHKAVALGFSSLSDYMIFAALNAEIKVTVKKESD